jgi:two-component system chemotaxis response regulator CheB
VIRILVVDDSALVRKLFGRVLSEEPDFEVAFARNGVEALAQLDVFKPDVITLDVQMPEMNGIDCLDRIMLQRPCPVVMVSSLTAEGADATLDALKLGAVDFMPKPAGAVSLRMDEFAPVLKEKVRAAAGARLPASRRLKDRLRFKSGAMQAARVRIEAPDLTAEADEVRQGEGMVLIGTSTGGPPALEALLTAIPATFPWPILVAQHMPSGFTGPLSRRLNGLCALCVVEASQPMSPQAGHVYIGRGDADIVVSKRGGDLLVMPVPGKSSYPWHPSTDRLVRSAMEHIPATQLIGVLMTGMGNDGADAMTLLRAQGGRTIAEAEETAIVWGMPGELVRAGGASWVVPLPKIAHRLQRLVPADATRT